MSDRQSVCDLLVAFLQYWLLVVFAWILSAAFRMYYGLVEVVFVEKAKLCHYYLFGYGKKIISEIESYSRNTVFTKAFFGIRILEKHVNEEYS